MAQRPSWYRCAALKRLLPGRLSRGVALAAAWLAVVAVGSGASAVALTGTPPVAGRSHTVHDTRGVAAVGAVFHGPVSSSGDHFCSAAVVDSPDGDLVVTAAHCLNGRGAGLFFAPGYHDGTAPYGVWELGRVTVDPRWIADRDPDLDVAFVAVRSADGRVVQDVVGGYPLGGTGAGALVRLTGYPSVADAPLTCVNRVSALSPTQLRIACPGFSGGTSGSPWVTRDGTLAGVIGGFQRGGDTDDVSYSPVLGADVAALYRQAVSPDPA